jgi:hypothetical protein
MLSMEHWNALLLDQQEKHIAVPTGGLQVAEPGQGHRSTHAGSHVPAMLPSSENAHCDSPSRQRRNPGGLGPLAFGLLVSLNTMIVVGAAVGGGVGGLAASRKIQCTCSSRGIVWFQS